MNDNIVSIMIETEERLSSILNNIDVGLLLQGPNSEIFMSNEKKYTKNTLNITIKNYP